MSPRPRHGPVGGPRLHLPLLAGALIASIVLASGERLWRADFWLYDHILSLAAGSPVSDPRVIIVAIDEYSLEERGQWPWSRSLHAEAIQRLTAAGVKGIAIDLMFAETHGMDPDGDPELVAAMAASGNVVMPVTVAHRQQHGPMIEVLPLPELAAAATALGHTDIARDRDGLTRGVFLHAGLGEARWSALALALLQTGEHKPPTELPGQRRPAAEPASPYQWARDHYVLLPPGKPAGVFTQVSFADLLAGRVPDPLLRDRWAMIGMTAAGYGGSVTTPGNQSERGISGVEFHAHVLRSLLDDSAVTPLSPRWSAVLASVFVLVAFVLYLLSPRNGPMAVALAVALLLATSAALLFGAGIWFPPAAALAVLIGGLLLLLSVHLRRFRHMASHDPMTGLANRRSLAESFQREWRSAMRSGRPIALLLADVDAFKAYNDRYGHHRGDGALRMVGQVIARTARRPRDLAARSGGEEFAVLLPETGLEAARYIAEDLRARVLDLNIHHADSEHGQRLTVSIGVHACVPESGGNLDALYDAADQAMYQAKKQGRNRVCTFAPAADR